MSFRCAEKDQKSNDFCEFHCPFFVLQRFFCTAGRLVGMMNTELTYGIGLLLTQKTTLGNHLCVCDFIS